jgi:hypothetical protein|nr:hypothetical protein [uncultured Eubacterium sp.]
MKSNQDNYIRELNTNHVMFFKEFAGEDKKKVIIDATRGTGKVSVRPESIDELFDKGYKIYRKK